MPCQIRSGAVRTYVRAQGRKKVHTVHFKLTMIRVPLPTSHMLRSLPGHIPRCHYIHPPFFQITFSGWGSLETRACLHMFLSGASVFHERSDTKHDPFGPRKSSFCRPNRRSQALPLVLINRGLCCRCFQRCLSRHVSWCAILSMRQFISAMMCAFCFVSSPPFVF